MRKSVKGGEKSGAVLVFKLAPSSITVELSEKVHGGNIAAFAVGSLVVSDMLRI